MKQKNIINDAIVKDIAEVVHDLDNGVVTIRVDNSRIVQLEVTGKKRFDEVWHIEGGGI